MRRIAITEVLRQGNAEQVVIPAKAGIQRFGKPLKPLDPGFRRDDDLKFFSVALAGQSEKHSRGLTRIGFVTVKLYPRYPR